VADSSHAGGSSRGGCKEGGQGEEGAVRREGSPLSKEGPCPPSSEGGQGEGEGGAEAEAGASRWKQGGCEYVCDKSGAEVGVAVGVDREEALRGVLQHVFKVLKEEVESDDVIMSKICACVRVCVCVKRERERERILYMYI
jgi:hypothetical protein